MERIIELTIMMFKNLSIYEVISSLCVPDKSEYVFTRDEFKYFANRKIPELSNDEIYNLYDVILEKISDEKEYLQYDMRKKPEQGKLINVFDTLLMVATSCLDERYGLPVCQYEHILLWRIASLELGEDLFISAFLAYRDIKNPSKERNFCWKPIVSHNNTVLKKILDRGLAENHFHLNGSAQFFALSWINLMNNIENYKFKRILDKIDKKRLNSEFVVGSHDNDSLYLRCLKAAVIRYYLFLYLEKTSYKYKKCIPKWLTRNEVLEILKSDENTAMVLSHGISNVIFAEVGSYSKYEYDYARMRVSKFDDKNEYYAGEREVMYSIFKCIYSHKADPEIASLFHVYILLKESIRAELVQSNSVIGFDNFREYQNRKSWLVKNTPLESIFYRTATKDTISNQPMIEKMEVRIQPSLSAKRNHEIIRLIDNCAMDKGINEFDDTNKETDFKKKFFYTMHFIKSKEKSDEIVAYDLCRHSSLREKIKQQTFALMKFREYYPETALRVKGIDAASSEIGCRPEVFAHAFRVLRNHEISLSYSQNSLERLGVTYHVGEDFIDIIDGLRAIDETLLFLNMNCGDRLGHAMVLGIDVEEWYKLKKKTLIISQQDYLDNIVWLYSKIIEFRIDTDTSLMAYLENEFYKYFRLVYQENMSVDNLKVATYSSNDYNDVSKLSFNINTYYNSWKIRGDDPQNYINGYYDNMQYTDIWEWHSVNRLYPLDKSIRKSIPVAFLYYTYHYNADVKIAGNKKITVSIPRNMLEAVKAVQNKLQHIIAYKGICIEINPSSNCLIGTFGKYSYEKHPILKFYNDGLESRSIQNTECQQIAVCINTDDQSVFGTSLENEYALMVRALENDIGADGKRKYDRNSIYDWVDRVRKMGLDFSFI